VRGVHVELPGTGHSCSVLILGVSGVGVSSVLYFCVPVCDAL
jgi:hypothetical protein